MATIQDVAGKAIDWLIGNVVYPDDLMGDGTPPPDDALDRVNALAVTSPPGANGVVFAPWLNGERTPVDDPHVRGGWVGVSLETIPRRPGAGRVRGHRPQRPLDEGRRREVRAQGAARRVLGRSPTSGGGAQSELWCQTLADVLGCTVRQAEDPVLANARGAAFLAAIGIGELAWSDIPGLVRIARTYEPDPAAAAVHDRSYRTFTQLYRKVKGLYRARR